MKTDINIKDDIYSLIKGSLLEQETTGVLRKTMRPANSNKEDIVISVLANENGQIQQGYANVNVYVQDVYRDKQSESNEPRLRQLCDICKELFERVNGGTYRIALESQRVHKVEGKDEHLINNKLLYKQCNE